MQLSLQEALKKVFAAHKWDSKMAGMRIAMDWEKIMGKTINNYTRSIQLKHKILYVKTDIPILRHEFVTNKPQLIEKINQFYDADVVQDIRVS